MNECQWSFTEVRCNWTGSGKSSLFAALLRLTDISIGRICIDGMDAKAVPLAALRTAVTVVPQQPLVFSGELGGFSRVYSCFCLVVPA